MYKGDRPDNEEYLLGRKIDRHVEGQEEPEVKKGQTYRKITKQFAVKATEKNKPLKKGHWECLFLWHNYYDS